MNKKHLLIEPYSFIPIDSGGKNRIFHTIKELSKRFPLQVFTFYSSNEEVKATEKYLDSQKIPNQSFSTRSKNIFSFLKWGIPYWFSDWYSPELTRALFNLDYSQFLSISVEFTQLLYLVDVLPKSSRRIFTAHDISTISFWRRLKSDPNILKRIIGLFRLLEIYLYEKKYLPKFDQVVVVSDKDAVEIKRLFNIKNIVVIPNGIEKNHILPPRQANRCINIGFIGAESHPPNKQAIDFLLNQLVPEIEKQHIAYKLIIAGNNAKTSKNMNISYLGYIQDVEYFYQKIDLLVAPIFSGSGSRIKILESISFGRPVLTTKIGAEGINLNSSNLKIIPKKQEKCAKYWIACIQDKQRFKMHDKTVIPTWKQVFAHYTV